MVCEQCQKLINKLITPDYEKSKRDVKASQNMILNKRKILVNFNKCLNCNTRCEGGNKYCLTCAYTKGICEICGGKMSDMKSYKFTDVDSKDNKRKNKMMLKTKEISEQILLKKRIRVEGDKDDEIFKFGRRKKNNFKELNENNNQIKDIDDKDEKKCKIVNEEKSSSNYISNNKDDQNNEDDYEYDEIIKI